MLFKYCKLQSYKLYIIIIGYNLLLFPRLDKWGWQAAQLVAIGLTDTTEKINDKEDDIPEKNEFTPVLPKAQADPQYLQLQSLANQRSQEEYKITTLK